MTDTGPYIEPTDGDPTAFVDRILAQARDTGASDVYWLPDATGMRVELRANGVHRLLTEVSAPFGQKCVARIKVLAGLLTYRTSIAQDGSIHAADAEKRERAIRVAVMPTLHGERATLRLLQTEAVVELDAMGFTPPVIEALRRMLARPTGMIVLTGPTGSGKTTTIYAMIRELITRASEGTGVITLEDPIERRINGITQTAVSHEGEWNYANALRATLRQDVKTIVVGELRDREVVRMALDAALTGHRVLTTFHAGDIPSVYTRMLHMGFEPFLVASAVTGVVAQRLVPLPDREEPVPVVATLVPDDAWQELVLTKPSLSDLREHLASYPGAGLKQIAATLVESGTLPDGDRPGLQSLLG